MLFRKNVSRKERIVRIAGGGLTILCGLAGVGLTPLGWSIAAVGLGTVMTGVARYCPACAIAGKKSTDSADSC